MFTFVLEVVARIIRKGVVEGKVAFTPGMKGVKAGEFSFPSVIEQTTTAGELILKGISVI